MNPIAARAQPVAEHDAAPTTHGKATPLHQDAKTSDWPGFLGPKRDGSTSETHLRQSWPKTGPPLLWERQRGSGYAAPSVVGENLILFHRIADKETIECVNTLTGERKWLHQYPCAYRDRYGYNNGPRTAPMIEGQHVTTLGVAGELRCLDLKDGTVVWQRNLTKEYNLAQEFFGIGASPLIEGERLIVNVGAGQKTKDHPRGANVVAFDKNTGKVLWENGDAWTASYASPVAATIHGQRRVFVFAGGESRPPTGGLLCINPENGDIDFRFPWRSESFESVNASNPVIIDNQVFISASYDAGSVLIRIEKDFTPTVVWRNGDVGLHFNTAVYDDGVLYGFDGRNPPDAALVAIDFKTGKTLWREAFEWNETYTAYGEERTRPFGIRRGTLIKADGKYLCIGEMGHLLWLDLSRQGAKITSRHWMFAAPETWTPPTISKGLVYIMQNHADMHNNTPIRLLCYDMRQMKDK